VTFAPEHVLAINFPFDPILSRFASLACDDSSRCSSRR
jgi:hypothetical protein